MVDELVRALRRASTGPGCRARRPADFAPPGGICLVGWLGDEPVAVGAREAPRARTSPRSSACTSRRPGARRASRARCSAALEDAARDARLRAGAARHRAAAAARASAVPVGRLPRDRRLQRQPGRVVLGREGPLAPAASGSPSSTARAGDGGASGAAQRASASSPGSIVTTRSPASAGEDVQRRAAPWSAQLDPTRAAATRRSDAELLDAPRAVPPRCGASPRRSPPPGSSQSARSP